MRQQTVKLGASLATLSELKQQSAPLTVSNTSVIGFHLACAERLNSD